MKGEKFLLVLYALALVLLFLMSSTDLIIKEKKVEVYPISVIIEDEKDEYYVNFKKGAEHAAITYQADVSFVTLYERNNQNQQSERISREISDGARALIVAPVKERDLAKLLDGNRISVPLVLLQSELIHDRTEVEVSTDHYEMGSRLAESVISREPVSVPVYLLSEGLEYGSNRKIYEGVSAVLEEAGYHFELYTKTAESTFQKLVESLESAERKEVVLLALDIESLTSIVEILEGTDRERVRSLYGAGGTLHLLRKLDEGLITAMTVTNDYDAGYMCIKKAVELIRNGSRKETVEVNNYVITKDDIRKKEFEKILYPMD